MIFVGEWFIQDYFIKGGIKKHHHSYLFAQKLCTGRITFLNSGDVKPYRLGRPTGSASLFNHERSILDSKTLNHLDQIKTNSKVGKFLAVANSGGSSVSQNKLPQLILGYIYILKYLQSNFIG